MPLKNKGLLFFIVALLGLYAVINPIDYISTRPHGDHAWAQCDRASWALNYYQLNCKLTEPRTHNIVYNETGIATGEFPAIPYLVSKLYAWLGFHEYLFRLTVLLLTLPAFIFSFSIAVKYLSKTSSVLTASLLWLCSPNLLFYSIGFLPDTVALSFFVVGLCFILRDKQLNYQGLFLFVLFTSIAVLLKSSVLFLVATVYVALFVTNWQTGKIKDTLIKTSLLLVPLVICAAWIWYGRHCQQKYNSNVFKLGFLLPHSFNDVVKYVTLFIRNLPKIYPVSTLLLLCAGAIVFIRNFNRHSFFHVFTLTGTLLWFLFFMLLMRHVGHHGYYHVPFQVLVFALSVSVLQIMESNEALYKRRIISIGALGLVSFFLYAITIHKISSHYDLINKDWLDLEPELRSVCIKPTDKVFSAYDGSYNISLYFMNQQGWNSMPDAWDSYNNDGLNACNYAVITNDSILNSRIIMQHIDTLLVTHNTLKVYRLKH